MTDAYQPRLCPRDLVSPLPFARCTIAGVRRESLFLAIVKSSIVELSIVAGLRNGGNQRRVSLEFGNPSVQHKKF